MTEEHKNGKPKPKVKRSFSHRPFSMTVERILDAPMFLDIGDINLGMYLKLPPDKVDEFIEKVKSEKAKNPDGFVVVYVEGIQK